MVNYEKMTAHRNAEIVLNESPQERGLCGMKANGLNELRNENQRNYFNKF